MNRKTTRNGTSSKRGSARPTTSRLGPGFGNEQRDEKADASGDSSRDGDDQQQFAELRGPPGEVAPTRRAERDQRNGRQHERDAVDSLGDGPLNGAPPDEICRCEKPQENPYRKRSEALGHGYQNHCSDGNRRRNRPRGRPPRSAYRRRTLPGPVARRLPPRCPSRRTWLPSRTTRPQRQRSRPDRMRPTPRRRSCPRARAPRSDRPNSACSTPRSNQWARRTPDTAGPRCSCHSPSDHPVRSFGRSSPYVLIASIWFSALRSRSLTKSFRHTAPSKAWATATAASTCFRSLSGSNTRLREMWLTVDASPVFFPQWS